uniref:Uncharacterized protein n=1 Tax=Anguilla anguilla TaxID=7936 RepID=A0A0E9UE20_ANGAN
MVLPPGSDRAVRRIRNDEQGDNRDY